MTRPCLTLLLLLAAIPAFAQTPPDPFQGHLQAGQTALRAGLPLVAAREYQAAVRLRPADADAHYTLAGVLEAAGRADEAMAEYRRTLALRPDHAPAHNALAGLLEDRGDRVAALDQYRQAVALTPSDPRLHFNLGAALAEAGQRDAAAAQYREALRLKPDFADAAQALRALGPISAIGPPRPSPLPLSPHPRPLPHGMGEGSKPKTAAPLPSDSPLPLAGEGLGVGAARSHALALARAGRLPEAIAAFHVILAHDPRDAAARLHLGVALYADGQTAQARREWGQVAARGGRSEAAQARRLLARYP